MRFCTLCRSLFRGNVDQCSFDGTPLVDVDEDPIVGTTVERFHVLRRLAVGATANVYLAEHRFLGWRSALKILHGDLACDPEFRDRFQKEARSAGQINHPNVVRIHDFEMTPGRPTFLVMEYVDGRSLLDTIAIEAPFEPPRARRILTQITEGLSAAHGLGFVHRDLKPANVMLTGQPEEVKILDFGAVATTEARSDLRRDDRPIIGTPAYMAPEQARGEPVGTAADLYSVGCILYEMLAGRPPLIDEKRRVSGPPLSNCDGLERIAAALLEHDVSRRLQSCFELLDRLASTPDDRSVDVSFGGSATTAIDLAPSALFEFDPAGGIPLPAQTVPDLSPRQLATDVVRTRRRAPTWMSELLEVEPQLARLLNGPEIPTRDGLGPFLEHSPTAKTPKLASPRAVTQSDPAVELWRGSWIAPLSETPKEERASITRPLPLVEPKTPGQAAELGRRETARSNSGPVASGNGRVTSHAQPVPRRNDGVPGQPQLSGALEPLGRVLGRVGPRPRPSWMLLGLTLLVLLLAGATLLCVLYAHQLLIAGARDFH